MSGKVKIDDTIFNRYKVSKYELKIIERNMEIYKNNYYNLEEKTCIKMIKELQEQRNKIVEFMNQYEVIFEELSECEKVYIEERYYKQKKVYELKEYFQDYCKEILEVIIKSRKKLHGVSRDYPYNLLHINEVILNKFSVLDNIDL